MAFKLLSEFTVENLPPKMTNMITVNQDDSLPKVFKTLASNNILAVPVLNEKNRPIGLVDFVDIVCCVTQIINHTDLLGTDYYSFLEREDLFNNTRANFITDLSERNPFAPVVKGASLLEAMTVMTMNKTNRIPIIENDSIDGAKIINLVTQSALMSFLSKNLEALGPWTNKSLKSLGFKEKHVISIEHYKKAIDAFQLMANNRVNGIAVVDDKGALMANISARDLRELLNETKMFENLYITVSEFVSRVRMNLLKTVYPSICCSFDDSLASIMTKMCAAHIHRIYVVDQDKKPIGVISFHDIIEKILEFINSGEPSQ
ncbi:hypothetical protein DLAC_04020 [Tieghemostelium lacteum]|uniref:CBS domain-containing protein n=1 Tax=Tieghemostelium lacteum TaxID=361077 RepID=A0A151ZS15_TIELA|nr:hypothetical protein DLAC_04020 [Tieghemostelium lacteum]|eukprot:KYQ96725.1 hypothetical protein DLAC_04020 [Tieghemostelium lacteum]